MAVIKIETEQRKQNKGEGKGEQWKTGGEGEQEEYGQNGEKQRRTKGSIARKAKNRGHLRRTFKIKEQWKTGTEAIEKTKIALKKLGLQICTQNENGGHSCATTPLFAAAMTANVNSASQANSVAVRGRAATLHLHSCAIAHY